MFYLRVLVGPKFRLDFQFKHALDHTAQIMTKNLAQGFVDLCGFSLAPQRIAKL